mgnify:FL=1
MTTRSLKRSQGKLDIPATGVEQSMKSMNKEKLSSPTLKVLNDLYLVETDPPAKYDGSLEIPDAYRAYYENLPETGVIVSRGNTTRYQLEPGVNVRFGKHCGQRFKYNGKYFQLIREYDLLATLTRS